MKIKRSRIIVIVILVIAVTAMVFKLKSNRERLNEDVAISQRKVERIPVSVETARLGIMGREVMATGVLEAEEVLTVVSETQGRIVKVLKGKGDYIAAGDVIVKVDDEVIAAGVLTAEANYEQFQRDLDRLTRLAGENAVTKRDLEQTAIGLKKAKADLINARKALGNTSIKSPISGYINNDFVTMGQFLGGGTPVCEIVNNHSLKMNIKVTESEVFELQKGQKVKITLTAFPGQEYTGKIVSIAEKADAAMKFNVEIALNNDSRYPLKSGIYAEAELPVKHVERILISKAAIIGSMERPEVFVSVNQKAEKRSLVIGRNSDNQVEVLKGLSVGDKVIVSGQLNIRQDDQVKVVN